MTTTPFSRKAALPRFSNRKAISKPALEAHLTNKATPSQSNEQQIARPPSNNFIISSSYQCARSRMQSLALVTEAALRLMTLPSNRRADLGLLDGIVSCDELLLHSDSAATLERHIGSCSELEVLSVWRRGQKSVASVRQTLELVFDISQDSMPVAVFLANQHEVVVICMLSRQQFVFFDCHHRSDTRAPYLVVEPAFNEIKQRIQFIWPVSLGAERGSSLEIVVAKGSRSLVKRNISSRTELNARYRRIEELIRQVADEFSKLSQRSDELEEEIGKSLNRSANRPTDNLRRIRLTAPTFDCVICAETVHMSKVFIVSGCLHAACTKCMTLHFRAKIDDGDYPLPCPFCQDSHINEREAAALLDSNELKLLEKNNLNRMFYQHCFHCPRPDCPYFAEVVPPRSHFYCELCHLAFCVRCNQSWHAGACRTASGLNSFEQVKVCPQCSNGIEKTHGCNHVRCRCGVHFCFRCSFVFASKDWEDHGCYQFDEF